MLYNGFGEDTGPNCYEVLAGLIFTYEPSEREPLLELHRSSSRVARFEAWSKTSCSTCNRSKQHAGELLQPCSAMLGREVLEFRVYLYAGHWPLTSLDLRVFS